ncbi:LysR family transcriptional regulator [Halocynthiibacter sp. C4]|uniref:LysR family transcriptional regulator n=1 Tax=Halocynthiibacter sp. C4 TaxID=2992758 RepID=UPI00237A8EF3|nr:LysR family transcriptional regulator [Halocynthiibacter sp. C4]MDE0588547.1 LysR family transcriptional regulator [Halocynthiibacter sp. C4]
MHKRNWDDLRFVLTVVDQGSVSAAAKLLGVNHATVIRRVAAFEDDHGGPIFARSHSGYRVLPDRWRVIEAAREVENAMFAVERTMQSAVAPLRGVVRVSSTDSFCQILLPKFVARLHSESSELTIDLLSNNSHLDFARMQADISVRPTPTLPDDMRGEIACDLGFGAYAAKDAPETWLGLTGELARAVPARWMATHIAPEHITIGADSFLVLREMAVSGLGKVVLPRFLGDAEPQLRLVPVEEDIASVPVWVASHADMRIVPRIRAVADRLAAYLGENADQLAGRGPE